MGNPPHAVVWSAEGGYHRFDAVGGFINPASDGSFHFHIEWHGWLPRLAPLALFSMLAVGPTVGEICMGRPPFSQRTAAVLVIAALLFLIWAVTFLRWIAGAKKDIASLKAFAADIA